MLAVRCSEPTSNSAGLRTCSILPLLSFSRLKEIGTLEFHPELVQFVQQSLRGFIQHEGLWLLGEVFQSEYPWVEVLIDYSLELMVDLSEILILDPKYSVELQHSWLALTKMIVYVLSKLVRDIIETLYRRRLLGLLYYT